MANTFPIWHQCVERTTCLTWNEWFGPLLVNLDSHVMSCYVMKYAVLLIRHLLMFCHARFRFPSGMSGVGLCMKSYHIHTFGTRQVQYTNDIADDVPGEGHGLRGVWLRFDLNICKA